MQEKLGRNDVCWCGSGTKYKKCHGEADEKMEAFRKQGFQVPGRRLLKTRPQIEGILASSKINIAVLDEVAKHVAVGVSTQTLNEVVHETTVSMGGIPAPLNYHGFPKSVCISINHVVCHGIPSAQQFLQDGDIVNIDVSTVYQGYYSDSSRMFCVGNVSAENRGLVETAKNCMELGIAVIAPWGWLGDVGEAVNACARENGCSVVREIGGHGVGLAFHEDPWVSYVSKKGTGMLLVPGMVFTVEPMVNMGTASVKTDPRDGWTVYTADGKPSAQWEKTVLVTETGHEVLTW